MSRFISAYIQTRLTIETSFFACQRIEAYSFEQIKTDFLNIRVLL